MRSDHPIPTLRPGQRLKQGDIARTNAGVPREIVGGAGTTVRTIGNRAIVTAKKGKGGGGGLTISTVLTLPAIPTSGAKFVFWTSAGAGTGDDQIWVAYAGQTAYTPMQAVTSLSGTP